MACCWIRNTARLWNWVPLPGKAKEKFMDINWFFLKRCVFNKTDLCFFAFRSCFHFKCWNNDDIFNRLKSWPTRSTLRPCWGLSMNSSCYKYHLYLELNDRLQKYIIWTYRNLCQARLSSKFVHNKMLSDLKIIAYYPQNGRGGFRTKRSCKLIECIQAKTFEYRAIWY